MPVGNAGGQYADRPWSRNTPPPGTSPYSQNPNEQYLCDMALASANQMTDDQVREIRPALGVPLFRPMYGYDRRALSIDDMRLLDDRFQRVDYTGRQSGYSGSSTPAYNGMG